MASPCIPLKPLELKSILVELAIRFPWSIVNCVNREAKCPVLTPRG